MRKYMAEKCIDNFIDFAHKQLSLIENKDGEVIYSSKDTLKKGKYYFLGLNPGGEGFISIKNHLNNFSLKTDNSFFDDSWNNCEKGKAPLQLRDQYLFEKILNYDLRNVFATNLIFETTMVVNGHAEAIVVETGMNTKVGKIAQMIIKDEAPETPLQIKLRRSRKKTRTCCSCNLLFNICNRIV